jgi:hypothetical protein
VGQELSLPMLMTFSQFWMMAFLCVAKTGSRPEGRWKSDLCAVSGVGQSQTGSK